MEPTERPLTLSAIPNWILAGLPLLLLLALVAGFLLLDPLAIFGSDGPPLEELTVQRVVFPEPDRVELSVVNGGPETVTIAQVLVDEAYWPFTADPDNTLDRLERTTLTLAYPWVIAEPLEFVLITSTGATFAREVEVAVETPGFDIQTFTSYGLLGIYVGVIPVALGLLWYPFMRRIEKRWMNAALALTVGLLVFLFVDTSLEAVEIAEGLPEVFQGIPVVIFGTLFSLGVLLAIGSRSDGGGSAVRLATLIALGIGLHNLGEGLAIGAAFATGATALGSFLVIGFTLHNVTEGVGIAAPLVRRQRPAYRVFLGLALLAGGPAILGTWIGGLAYSPLLAVIFLSLGAGAILQVIWEVAKLLWHDARQRDQSALTWLNLASLAAGVLVMYLTAFLVKF
ncbi:MAG: hypothetical protein R3300_05200 [Candidatus Promineifilaceae bacterium]|nr:hypothetical protein [Candidatus Promineifilaceae bacterium]